MSRVIAELQCLQRAVDVVNRQISPIWRRCWRRCPGWSSVARDLHVVTFLLDIEDVDAYHG